MYIMNFSQQKELARSLEGQVVLFVESDKRDRVEELDTYICSGMMGKIESIRIQPHDDREGMRSSERVWKMRVDVRGFRKHNDPLQSHGWYLDTRDYTKTGTAYEAGAETDVIDLYTVFSEEDNMFLYIKPVGQDTPSFAAFNDYIEDPNASSSFVQWLSEKYIDFKSKEVN